MTPSLIPLRYFDTTYYVLQTREILKMLSYKYLVNLSFPAYIFDVTDDSAVPDFRALLIMLRIFRNNLNRPLNIRTVVLIRS